VEVLCLELYKRSLQSFPDRGNINNSFSDFQPDLRMQKLFHAALDQVTTESGKNTAIHFPDRSILMVEKAIHNFFVVFDILTSISGKRRFREKLLSPSSP
jgi:hypothetical protein